MGGEAGLRFLIISDTKSMHFHFTSGLDPDPYYVPDLVRIAGLEKVVRIVGLTLWDHIIVTKSLQVRIKDSRN